MIAAVADTHTAAWYLFNNTKLSAGARQAIEEAFRAGDLRLRVARASAPCFPSSICQSFVKSSSSVCQVTVRGF
jgi:hypothetical protein